jgi:hypothetical protein
MALSQAAQLPSRHRIRHLVFDARLWSGALHLAQRVVDGVACPVNLGQRTPVGFALARGRSRLTHFFIAL